MPIPSASTEVFSSKAFLTQSGSSYMLAGEGGIGKSKIRKVVRAVKKQGPKAIRASLALLDEFGNPDKKQKVAMARKAASIVKGAGPPPGHKLRKLCKLMNYFFLRRMCFRTTERIVLHVFIAMGGHGK